MMNGEGAESNEDTCFAQSPIGVRGDNLGTCIPISLRRYYVLSPLPAPGVEKRPGLSPAQVPGSQPFQLSFFRVPRPQRGCE
jgi:hypothetical protein